jgi:hypothetical protein
MLHGKKRMHFWPNCFFRGNKEASHSTKYERFLPAATTVEATAGDVIYWPSDNWHVVECVDGLAASISLALFVHSRPSPVVDFWRRVLDVSEGRTLPANTIPKLHRAVASMLNETSTRAEITSKLAADWLNRTTGFGFERVPPPRSQKHLHVLSLVGADADFPILCSRGGDTEIVCSVNGHAFVITRDPQIPRVIKRLNSGRICRVGDLINERDGESGIRGGLRSFLEKLYALRGISEFASRSPRQKTPRTKALSIPVR